MGDEHILNLQEILQPLERRVPRIVLQRVEEIFPALNESLVSVVCAEKSFIFISFTRLTWPKKHNIL
jgi:hypothetical protein